MKSTINSNRATQILSLILAISAAWTLSSCKNEGCGYADPCIEICQLLDDFEATETGTPGNWQTLAANASIQVQGSTKTLHLQDQSGASWAFNNVDFPGDLIQAGCELRYDVEYQAGASNGTTTSNSIHIYQGSSPAAATAKANFVLNSSSLIVSGAGVSNIVVPIELATGSALPSNAFGQWFLTGGAVIPTPADIAAFNTLIQNINGVGFFVDNGSNPAEDWWYDNFCFQQCCR